jgi:DnaJ-class molecular chaperone
MCLGNGYSRTAERDVVLCQDCKGMRMLDVSVKKTCSSCEGMGFFPKLMQRFEAVDVCPNCDGVGRRGVRDGTTRKCSDCDGVGGTGESDCGTDGEFYTVEEWRSRNKGARKDDLARINEINGELCLDSADELVRIVRCSCQDEPGRESDGDDGDDGDGFCESCESCESGMCEACKIFNRAKECELCDGIGSFVYALPRCITCSGTGKVPVLTGVVCSNCCGTGKVILAEDRVV